MAFYLLCDLGRLFTVALRGPSTYSPPGTFPMPPTLAEIPHYRFCLAGFLF
jgi:hypothetical protein